jgi:hypothetical protein
VHGKRHAHSLTGEDRARFAADELIVLNDDPASLGTNRCTAYHPERYVRKSFARDLDVVDFREGRGADFSQDAYLLRKPGG